MYFALAVIHLFCTNFRSVALGYTLSDTLPPSGTSSTNPQSGR